MRYMLFLYLFISTVICLNCGITDSGSDFDLIPLTVNYYDTQYSYESRDLLASFKIDWKDPISIKHTKIGTIHIDNDTFGYRFYTEEKYEQDIIIFLIIINEKTDQIWEYVKRPYRSQFISMGKSAHYNNIEGPFYCFLIDGIGMRPQNPIEVTLVTDSKTHNFNIDPKTHTISNKFIHHITIDSLNCIPNKSQLAIDYQANSNSIPYIPLVIMNNSDINMSAHILDKITLLDTDGDIWYNYGLPFINSSLYLLEL